MGRGVPGCAQSHHMTIVWHAASRRGGDGRAGPESQRPASPPANQGRHGRGSEHRRHAQSAGVGHYVWRFRAAARHGADKLRYVRKRTGSMDTESFVLMALAAGGEKTYSPVQVQKLLFLLDDNIPESVKGPHFNFEPYDYGPFDKEVYAVLERLEDKNLVSILPTGRGWNKYTLTPTGFKHGCKHLNNLGTKPRTYAKKLAHFVTTVSFSQLVSAIYSDYPEMKVNSVFNS